MLTCCVANCKSCASDVGFIANEDFRSLPPLSDRLVLSQTRIFGPNPAPSHRIDLAKNRKNSELGKIKQMRIFGPPHLSPSLSNQFCKKLEKFRINSEWSETARKFSSGTSIKSIHISRCKNSETEILIHA